MENEELKLKISQCCVAKWLSNHILSIVELIGESDEICAVIGDYAKDIQKFVCDAKSLGENLGEYADKLFKEITGAK